MRSRKTLCLVVMLMVAAAGHACTAQAFDINDLNPWIPFSPFQPSRLAAFTARQSLRDSVNIALADGRIDASERFTILTRAKKILTPDEYQTFKRALDRASRPGQVARVPHAATQHSRPQAAPQATPELPEPPVVDQAAELDSAPAAEAASYYQHEAPEPPPSSYY